MMAKWADYGISKVRYDPTHSHIVAVLVHEDTGTAITTGVETTRMTVVNRIDGGSTFVTIRLTSESAWQRGADVAVVTIEEQKYIRTDANKTKSDNLGDLPEL